MKTFIIVWTITIALFLIYYFGTVVGMLEKQQKMLVKHHKMMIVGMCCVGKSLDEINK